MKKRRKSSRRIQDRAQSATTKSYTTKGSLADVLIFLIQLQFRKIKTEFQKIQLVFSKVRKQFLDFQLESFDYSDTCIWKF